MKKEKKNLEKQMAVALAVVLGAVLLGCTAAAQLIYWEMLPRVRQESGIWNDRGLLLPSDAVYPGPYGYCVYHIEEEPGRFATIYLVKETMVYVDEKPEEGEMILVQGVYDKEWTFAAGTEVLLKHDMEVKLKP